MKKFRVETNMKFLIFKEVKNICRLEEKKAIKFSFAGWQI